MISVSKFFRLYMKRKYGTETWFQGGPFSQSISAKDALKFSLAKPLETLLVSKDLLLILNFPMIEKSQACIKILFIRLFYMKLKVSQDCKSGISNFRIRLTFSHKTSKVVQSVAVSKQGCKRIKTGM